MKVERERIRNIFETAELFGRVSRYKKIAKVDARRAVPGEVIITVVGGIIETQNTATADQVVVMNVTTKSREQQILDRSKFESRYFVTNAPTDNWGTYLPKGEVDAVEWSGDETQFEAPWGELMLIVTGDFLARVPGTTDDIYRIARDEFNLTYSLV